MLAYLGKEGGLLGLVTFISNGVGRLRRSLRGSGQLRLMVAFASY